MSKWLEIGIIVLVAFIAIRVIFDYIGQQNTVTYNSQPNPYAYWRPGFQNRYYGMRRKGRF